MAVNASTNLIYVANHHDNTVSVIDGASGTVNATIPVGNTPNYLAVNPVTNKIYVECNGADSVYVIDGSNNSTTPVKAGHIPWNIAVNPATNKIYVANWGDSTMTVIDGQTNATSTVHTAGQAYAITVDQVHNKVYVADYFGNMVTVIDGVTNSKLDIPAGNTPVAIAVNPVSGNVYAANYNSDDVTRIVPAAAYDTKVRVLLDPAVSHITALSQPALTGRAVNRWSPNRTDIMGVLGAKMTAQQGWLWQAGPFDSTSADSIGWAWNWGADSLLKGENLLCAVALESDAATTNNLGLGTPFAGNLLVYPLYRVDPGAYGVAGKPTMITAPMISVLRQSRPNPFSGATTIEYQLSVTGKVELTVYNIAGQKVRALANAAQSAGAHAARWDGRDDGNRPVAAGVYYCRLKAGRSQSIRKMVLVR